MNPINRVLIVLCGCLCVTILIAFTIPGVSEMPFLFIVESVEIVPLVVVISFTLDIMIFSREWMIENKLKVLMVYIVIIAYVFINYKWIIIAFNNIIDMYYWR